MTGLRALGGALVALVGVRSAAGAVILVPADVATIQGAIQWASSGDTILVAPGTYREQIDFLGKNVSVTAVRGPEATTIDAQGAGSVVTFAGGEGPDAILAGFTITGGHASEGGGILVLSSNPTIQDCIVTGNTCIGPNGGSAFFAGTTAAVMTCCTVSGNTNTTGADGAGVHATTGSTVVITGCQFIGNTATDGPYGRAIRLAGQSILRDCVISGNSPRGAYIHGDALVENCLFSGNGAMNVYVESNPTFDGCIISGAEIGMRAYATGCTLRGCRFDGASEVGLQMHQSHSLVIGCSIVQNPGVGLSDEGFFDNPGPLIASCLIALNGLDGMVMNGSHATVLHCTIAHNVGSAIAQNVDHCCNVEPVPSLSGCIVWGNVGGEWNGDVIDATYSDLQVLVPGPGNMSADPLFENPGAGDFHLLPGSPAIDAGPSIDEVLEDLDGNPRRLDDPATPDGGSLTCPVADIGAHEFPGARICIPCPWDCQAVPDGMVAIADLLALLAQWGLPTPCDLDEGGAVGINDLLELLARWGPCP